MLNITFRKTHYVNCFLVFHDYYIEKKPILLVFLFTNIFIKGCPHRKQIKPKVQPIVPSSGKKTYSANHKPCAFSVYIIYVHNIGLALGCRDILVRLYGFIYPCVVQEYLCNCVCINSHRLSRRHNIVFYPCSPMLHLMELNQTLQNFYS